MKSDSGIMDQDTPSDEKPTKPLKDRLLLKGSLEERIIKATVILLTAKECLHILGIDLLLAEIIKKLFGFQ